METEKQLRVLMSLAQLDIDAIELYEAAMKRVGHPEIHAKLAEFRVDHARHVQDLNGLIVARGGHALAHPDLKGAVLKAATAATSMLGTEAAMIAMVGNEELTNRSYDVALKLDWDPEARGLIEKNLSDERRHLEWFKMAAMKRPWAHEEREAAR